MTREEAIETVRRCCPRISDSECYFETAMRVLVPELAESEDERIKEKILECVSLAGTLDDVEKARAYLEKQKEQKPDTRTVDDLHLLGFIYDLLAGLEWSKDYAMSKDECLRRLNDYRPQRPAEWSEEDEHRRKDAIYFLESAMKHYADTSEIEKTIDWLKSLHPQQKEEWTEEDEKKLKRLCWIVLSIRVKGLITEEEVTELGKWMDKWLNHNPVLRWKPSEEQMSMLLAVIRDPNNAGSESCSLAFKSLYEQLKKL